MDTNEIQAKTNDTDIVKVANDFVDVVAKVADIYANNNQNKFELQQSELELRKFELENKFKLQQSELELQKLELDNKFELQKSELTNKKTNLCHAKLFLVGCIVLLAGFTWFGKLDTTVALAAGIVIAINILSTTKFFNGIWQVAQKYSQSKGHYSNNNE